MKMNFDQILRDLSGEPFRYKDKPTSLERDMTLKDAALVALCTALDEDRAMSGKQSFERLELARKINAGGELELDPEQVTLIQNRLPKVYPILIAGVAYELLKG